jgi:triacylglycerol lipase
MIIDDHLLARYSALAYQDPASVREACGVPVVVLHAAGTEAYGFVHDDVIIIAFRGTQPTSLTDLRSDLRFRKTQSDAFGPAKVHRGFKGALDPIWAELTATIEMTGMPVIFTGHSLGGALAVLAAAAVHYSQKGTVRAVVTFGQPRVGDAQLVLILDPIPWRRYVNLADPVARVPLWTMNFRHGGDMRFIGSKGQILRSPFALTVLQEIWSAHGFGVIRVTARGFLDHSMDKYVEALQPRLAA